MITEDYEDYVSFEIAKLLKAKGFNNDVLITDWWYDDSGISHKRGNYSYDAPLYDKRTCFNCPTLQMAMKWLREIHNIALNVCYLVGMWSYSVYMTDVSSSGFNSEDFDTYEEACEAGIKFCLENLI